MNRTDILAFWVIYENPADYPQCFVLRRHIVNHTGLLEIETRPRVVARTLSEARRALPAGLHNLGRFPNDEPQIKEVWV